MKNLIVFACEAVPMGTELGVLADVAIEYLKRKEVKHITIWQTPGKVPEFVGRKMYATLYTPVFVFDDAGRGLSARLLQLLEQNAIVMENLVVLCNLLVAKEFVLQFCLKNFPAWGTVQTQTDRVIGDAFVYHAHCDRQILERTEFAPLLAASVE